MYELPKTGTVNTLLKINEKVRAKLIPLEKKSSDIDKKIEELQNQKIKLSRDIHYLTEKVAGNNGLIYCLNERGHTHYRIRGTIFETYTPKKSKK